MSASIVSEILEKGNLTWEIYLHLFYLRFTEFFIVKKYFIPRSSDLKHGSTWNKKINNNQCFWKVEKWTPENCARRLHKQYIQSVGFANVYWVLLIPFFDLLKILENLKFFWRIQGSKKEIVTQYRHEDIILNMEYLHDTD